LTQQSGRVDSTLNPRSTRLDFKVAKYSRLDWPGRRSTLHFFVWGRVDPRPMNYEFKVGSAGSPARDTHDTHSRHTPLTPHPSTLDHSVRRVLPVRSGPGRSGALCCARCRGCRGSLSDRGRKSDSISEYGGHGEVCCRTAAN
jgi:hypothetical protein